MVDGLTLIIGFTLLLILAGIVGLGVMIYNKLVRLEKECKESWSNIDVLLKQRKEEIPKLVDTVEEYMDYEEEVLQKITKARTEIQQAETPKEQAEADSMLQKALGDLFAVAEDYPELQANESFTQLQERISSIEEQISDRREMYNETVRRWNTIINQIPEVILARAMNKKEKEMFEATEEEKESPDISEEFSN